MIVNAAHEPARAKRALSGRRDFEAWGAFLALGLYLSRMIAESSSNPWRLRYLLALLVGSLAVAYLPVRAWQRRGIRLWPLWLTLLYVFWPWAAPHWGLRVGLLALTALWLGNSPWRLPNVPWPEALAFLAGLTLYVITLAPSVLPADSGEFQLVAQVLGIAHPPGYPLYTLLGKLFTFLPVGDPAYRVNLLSAFLGALTLGVIVRSARRQTGSASAGLVAAAFLGLAPTFWAQSTTANIRSLTALGTALCLAWLLRWGQTRSSRDLALFAACFGLAVGHHASLALLAPAMVAYLAFCDPRLFTQPRRWPVPLGAFAASLLVWLYLPIRSRLGAPFNPAPIRTWVDFVEHVTAAGFRGDMFHYRTWPALGGRFVVWLDILRLQFGPMAPVALAGALPLVLRRPREAGLLLGVWALNTLAAMTYRAPQTIEYLLPSYVALGLLLALGLGRLGSVLARRRGLYALLIAALFWATLWRGASHYASFRLLHRDTSTRDYVVPILRAAPEGALILANWHYATAFWYVQHVEGLRPDVEVRYVYPEGATPNEELWLRRIAAGLEQRPVIVTNRFPAFLESGYRWIPLGRAWLVRREPLMTPPGSIWEAPALFDGHIRLLGYALDRADLSPGDTLRVTVYWQPLSALERDYSSFVQLLGSQGIVGQGDIVHRSSEYLPGEVLVDTYDVSLLLHTSPGSYQLITGFYYTAGDGWKRLTTQGGVDHAPLTTVQVQPTAELPPSGRPFRARFGGGWELLGIDPDRSVPDSMRFYLHWRRRPGASGASPAAEGAVVRLCAEGHLLGQATLPALPMGCAATVVIDLPVHTGALSLELAGIDGGAYPLLGPWNRPLGGLPLDPPAEGARFVPLGGKIALLGIDGIPPSVRQGETLRAKAHFLALRPLTDDYSLSLALESFDGAWHLRADGTPALGALPTLKWLKGWRVNDLRPLSIPQDAPEIQGIVALTAYDAFTVEPLPVLDERLVRRGQGTRLELMTISLAPQE
ncbi:MAG: DUF2723 domain-containing protein [Chloroflexi bacterium]|nr:DUF2723 domain-containing protein [Chloroflexota bacterium]